jgi:hypothetical protein
VRAIGARGKMSRVDPSAVKRAGALVIAPLLFMLSGSCASDGGDQPGRSASTTGATSTSAAEATRQDARYMLLDNPTWQLQEAVDYRAGLGALGEHDPDLDWFAEYDGPRFDNDDGSYTIPHVATFGHTASLETRRDQLPGFDLRSETVDGRHALIASAAAGNPAIVVIEIAADYTTTALTYDGGVDLRDLATHLKTVDEQQWIAAGGTLLDCVPLEPDCTQS